VTRIPRLSGWLSLGVFNSVVRAAGQAAQQTRSTVPVALVGATGQRACSAHPGAGVRMVNPSPLGLGMAQGPTG